MKDVNTEKTILVTYSPNIGIQIDGVNLKWGAERKIVRQLLRYTYSPSDKFIELSQYFNGDQSRNIYQRRDSYKGIDDTDCFFFLNYNNQDELSEFEVHDGCEIKIHGVTLSFNIDVKKAVTNLQTISKNFKKTDSGEYYFADLKLTIADSEQMGGEGHELAYFYCSMDTSHLD